MRVIAGSAKGLRLKNVDDDSVRPVTDRVKTALFNILVHRLPKANVLDLYAGAGSMGIEALSRGTSRAVFVDHNRRSVSIIKENLSHTRFTKMGEVKLQKVEDMVGSLKKNPAEQFDLIFFDPPFSLTGEQTMSQLTDLISEIVSRLMTDDGLLVFRHPSKVTAPEVDGASITDSRRYGINQLSFYVSRSAVL